MSIKKQHFFIATLLCVFLITSGCKTTSHASANATSSQNQISKNLKWSERMALTLMKKHERSYMIDDSKEAKWDYVHGLVLKSFEELYKKTNEIKYYNYIKDYVDTLVKADGTIDSYELEKYNIDMVVAGRLLFYVYDKTQDKKYLEAMQLLRKQIRRST